MSLPQPRDLSDFPKIARFRLLDAMPLGVLVTDTALRLVYLNRVAEKMLGYRSDEILGGHVGSLIPLTNLSRHQDLFPQRSARYGFDDSGDRNRECLLTSRNGSTFAAEISSFPVPAGPGEYIGVLLRDLTANRGHEREQRKNRRLADLGKAVSLISHEIRKRLTLIGGFARQLTCSRVLGRETSACTKLKIIVDEVGAMERMLDGIRLIGRLPQPAAHRPMDLNELVREAVQLMQPAFESLPIRLSTKLTNNPLTVRGDNDLLKQVLLNLLYNALDSLGGKGWIQVRSERREAVAARILVDDSGPGIPEDLQDRIFDPFFTTKTGGTGLGLAISKNIIEDHGGRIAFQAGTPIGTTFVIELPLQDDNPAG